MPVVVAQPVETWDTRVMDNVIWIDSPTREICNVLEISTNGKNLLLSAESGDWWIAKDRTIPA